MGRLRGGEPAGVGARLHPQGRFRQVSRGGAVGEKHTASSSQPKVELGSALLDVGQGAGPTGKTSAPPCEVVTLEGEGPLRPPADLLLTSVSPPPSCPLG